MKTIPSTIQTFSNHGEDFWKIDIPAQAAEQLSELLSSIRKRIVFQDRKTEFTLTTDTAAYNGQSISVTSDFLECLEKLFSTDIRPGRSHLDYDFSDKHSNICITLCIK